MSNPYTLVFGQPPLEMVERTSHLERIISEFCAGRPSNYINLVTGIRGCGKTVFITEIAGRLRSKKDWIVVNLNPQRDLLVSLAAKLDSDKWLHRIFQEAQINLSAFGIGVGVKGSTKISDIEEALIRMLSSIKKQNKRLLITIDEVSNTKDMRIFASAYQIFLRESLPVFLLMTGLYKNIDSLRNAEGMTFLERAPRTYLTSLNMGSMTKKYMEVLKLKEDEAVRLAYVTKGYSFAFQAVGYFSWEYPEDKDKALSNAREYVYEFAYRKIWSELSKTDRKVVAAITKVPEGEVYMIRDILGYTNNQFNPYRDRLIKSGVIISPGNGIVEFALPWFGEFCEMMTGEQRR